MAALILFAFGARRKYRSGAAGEDHRHCEGNGKMKQAVGIIGIIIMRPPVASALD